VKLKKLSYISVIICIASAFLDSACSFVVVGHIPLIQ